MCLSVLVISVIISVEILHNLTQARSCLSQRPSSEMRPRPERQKIKEKEKKNREQKSSNKKDEKDRDVENK